MAATNVSSSKPGASGDILSVAGSITYNADGNQAIITAKMASSSDDQVTTYVYGVTLDDSDISPSTVQRMLQNPIYYGAFRFKGELHDGIHEPLVTKSLFDRCQQVMSNRSKPKWVGQVVLT